MIGLIDWHFVVGFEGDWSTGYVPNIRDDKGRIRSGTSIVSGLDLGQHDEAYIRGLGVSPGLTEKLLPFVGARGPSAVMAAQARFERNLETLNRLNAQAGARVSPLTSGTMPPTGVIGDAFGPLHAVRAGQRPTHFVAAGTPLGLELTPAERHELTQAVRSSYYRDLAKHFDRERTDKPFALLPREIQTALMSLHWHSGSIWSRHHAARDVFDSAIRNDWAGAVDALRGGEIYSAARYFPFRKRRRDEAELIRKGAHLSPDLVGPKERRHLERVLRIGAYKARTA